jgi:glycerol-3-phosphate acyltransferase PlsY
VFFQFKGGKGVATTLGVLFGLNGLLGLVVIATWLLVAVITRYSSLAALVAIILAPLYALGYGLGTFVWPLCWIAAGVVYQHRENIQRLLAGKESKINM